MTWQPIETAPKDGQAILLLSKAYDEISYGGNIVEEVIHHPAKCHIGRWDTTLDTWTDEYGGYEHEICTLTVTGAWASGGGWFEPNEVSHWMPLPAPPVTPHQPQTAAKQEK